MRKLVLMMSVGALAVVFSAGAFAEDATTPSVPQTTPQAAPVPQGTAMQGARTTSKGAGAQAVHRHVRHHHRKAMTHGSAKATTTGSEKNPEAAASSAGLAKGKMAMAQHTTIRHHHRSHHRPAAKPQMSAPAPAAGSMNQTSPSTSPSSVN